MAKGALRQLVVCVKDDGYAVSLETRKIYLSIADPLAEKHGQLRVIDESGDNCLYPKAFFRVVALPPAVKKAVLTAARWRAAGRRTVAAETERSPKNEMHPPKRNAPVAQSLAAETHTHAAVRCRLGDRRAFFNSGKIPRCA